MRIVMTVLYLILIIVGVSFAALNASSVHVNFYFTRLDIPISVLMISTLGIGLLFGFFLFFYRFFNSQPLGICT